MLCEMLFAIDSAHEVQVDPHRLFDACFTYVHKERIGQVCRPIFPCRKGWRGVLRTSRAQTNAEGTGSPFPTRPPVPKESSPRIFALSFLSIRNPEQLNHCVREGKTPIGCALSDVPIGRPLTQTEPYKFLCFRSAPSSTNEQVIQLNAHACSLAVPRQRDQSALNPARAHFMSYRRQPGQNRIFGDYFRIGGHSPGAMKCAGYDLFNTGRRGAPVFVPIGAS